MHMSTRLSQNFTLGELCRSSHAAQHDVDNTPGPGMRENLSTLCLGYLQPLRDLLGRSIVINSGYRCVELNTAIGGSPRSAHCLGFAADIECPGISNLELACRLMFMLQRHNTAFDQIITEHCSINDPAAGWVHLGIRNANGSQREEILHAYKRDGRTCYAHGLC